MKTLFNLLIVAFSVFTFSNSTFAQTTYSWVGGSGNWNVATNWTPNGVPGVLDTAIINSGTATLIDNATVAKLELFSTLNGDSNLVVTNLMNWGGGNLQGSGLATIAFGATLRLSGTNQQSLFRNVENNGITIWEAGQFYLGGGITFTNNGSFLDQHSSSQTFSGGINGCTFINDGTYTKTGTGTSVITLPFYNNGSLELLTGALNLARSGTSSGSITLAAGFLLRIQGIPWDISGPISGEGDIEFWSPTTIRGNFNITGSTYFASNTTIFDTSATIISLNHGQELTISGTAEFNTGDPLSLDSLYLTGTLQGSDSLAIMESMNWASGVVQGSGTMNITSGATLRLSGTNQQSLFRNIENNGTTNWEAGNFYLGNGITFVNNGTFLDQHPGSEPFSGGINGCTFINDGTYTKTGTGTSGLTLPFFNNVGGIIRGIGSISLSYSFTNDGSVSPGDSLGTLNLTTNYPTAPSSELNIEIGGTTVDSLYDQLNITGSASLDGILNISLANNFVPALGDTFEILTFSSYTGNFNTINGLNTGTGVSFDVLSSPTSIKLVTINSPNNPPVTIYQISNMLLDEDFGSVTVANLDTIFDDSDIPIGDSLTYSFSVLNGLLNALITGNELQLHSVSDSNGVASVIVTATDTSLASVNDTFQVNINPVNDAPVIFNILEPQDGAVLTSADTINFLWQSSIDVDNDPLNYELRIFGASWDTTINSIADTSFEYLDNSSLQLNTTYQWTVSVFDGLISVASTDTFSFTTPQPNGIDDINNVLPKEFALRQNYPNPFNPTTTIEFDLPKASKVKIEIYNLLGKKVKTVLDTHKNAGHHKLIVNSNNLASGVYLYRIKAGKYTNSKKMILLR